MIFIIISNIGLALITVLVYMRHSHFRISYGNKIKELGRDLKAEREQKKSIESKLGTDFKKENEQVKSLLREMETLRKEREEEIKHRMEAEKEIEISREKIVQVQKRVEDWKLLQESAINDSKSVILKFGEDLASKIQENQHNEEERTREVFEENAKSIESNVNTLHQEIGGIDSKIIDFKKRFADAMKKQVIKNSDSVAVDSSTASARGKKATAASKASSAADVGAIEKPKNVKMDEVAEKSMKNVVSLVEASGLKHMKDFIVASRLDEKKSKYMLCDLFLLVEGVGYFVDFKADRYFADYDKFSSGPDQDKAVVNLKSRLDKYIAYISNPKYSALIKKLVAALKIEASEFKIVFAVRSYEDTRLISKIGYKEKVNNAGIELMDVNTVNDLIL